MVPRVYTSPATPAPLRAHRLLVVHRPRRDVTVAFREEEMAIPRAARAGRKPRRAESWRVPVAVFVDIFCPEAAYSSSLNHFPEIQEI